MYQSHWGLAKPPFPCGLDPELFYEGLSEREALARLRFLVEHQRRVGMLLGQTGLGKSLLLEIFANECRQQGCEVASIDLLGLSSREFLWELGCELHAGVRVEDDTLRMFRQLTDCLYENGLQQKQTIILLDNADQAGADLQTHLLRFAQMDLAGKGCTSLVLAVNESNSARLQGTLLELVDLRIDLHPWDELDTIGYLQLALVEAGAETPLFNDEALSKIHELAQGIPRRVNRLADYALMLGSQTPQQPIDAETIVEAQKGLSLPSRV